MPTLIDFCAPHTDSGAALRCSFDLPCQTLVAHTSDQVRPLLDAVGALARQGLWCVGYLRYEAAPAFDSALAVHAPDGPLAWFGVYEQAQEWPAEATEAPAQVYWNSGIARADFDQQMGRIHQAITEGELYQVNYTAPLHGTFEGNVQTLFLALRRAQPNGYAAFLDTGFEQVLSVSPELFFDWKDDRILVRPMKGTAARGASAQEDALQSERLRSSPKELAENVMIVDLLRNDLSRIAQPFTIKTPQLFQVQTLPTVFQMVSDVQAVTRDGTTLTDVFAALFPCGSITGAPKVRAMHMIQTLEPQARGIYCGAIGVVRPGGHATFNVAIRTVTLQGAAARCGFGSGITADATATDEWQEWRHKRGFLVRASQSFDLLETIRLEEGRLHRVSAHLARMARAAAHFAYSFDAAKLEPLLQQLAVSHPQGLWRVRLQLGANGQAQAQALPLQVTPTPVLLQLAECALEEADGEFVRFKTTHRAHYEAFAPTEASVFDTVLWNRQGEITECTRGNIAVLLDGRWVTPPLSCGLLNGVARAHYLQQQRLVEEVVRLADLPRAQALAFVNSLRGWVEARLQVSSV